MAPNLSPKGQQLAFGTAGPLTTRDGRLITADFLSAESKAALASMPLIPQTDRWPLPGSGQLHPLDYIVIKNVRLPLAAMPEGAKELDVSERKEPGSDYASFVSHGLKSVPVRISLILFRDQTLGYKDGALVGKDWIAEFGKIEKNLIAPKLQKRFAVPVFYHTLHHRGCDSLIFVRQGDPRMVKPGQFSIELEGHDPRTVRTGGGSHKVKQTKDFGTRANPIPKESKESKTPSASQKGK